MTSQNLKTFESVRELVCKIPRGRVATYGDIARAAETSPRVVGQALHKNPDPKRIPCHRVVNHKGRIADAYAFGGAAEQRRRLVGECIVFRDEMHVDLSKCLWHFSKIRSTNIEYRNKH